MTRIDYTELETARYNLGVIRAMIESELDAAHAAIQRALMFMEDLDAAIRYERDVRGDAGS